MREHGTKTTPVFLPADGEASWSLLPSSISLLSGGTVQPENTYSSILKVTGQVWESQKRISIALITATTSVDLPKPVSTDLTIKPDSVLTNPIGKDGVRILGVKICQFLYESLMLDCIKGFRIFNEYRHCNFVFI